MSECLTKKAFSSEVILLGSSLQSQALVMVWFSGCFLVLFVCCGFVFVVFFNVLVMFGEHF